MTLQEHYSLWAIERQQTPSCNVQRDRFLAEVTKTARKIVWSRCPEYADDIAQDTTVEVWRRIDKFDSAKSSISSWIRLITNHVLNRQLSGLYQQGIPADVDIDTIDLSTYEYSSDDHTRLRKYFSDDPELLNLLLQGYSLVDCEQKLGLTRKANNLRKR